MSVYMMPAKEGNCQVCATKHDPGQPHNNQSLPYQIWFQSTYNRGSTWVDAIAHCELEVQELWRNELKKMDKWTEPKGDSKPIATVDENKGKAKPKPMPNMKPKTYTIKTGK